MHPSIQQIADYNLAKLKAEAERVDEKSIEELGPFEWSTHKDQQGVPVELPEYAKRSCNNCYGRGYVYQLIGGRHHQTCGCVQAGYMRATLKAERNRAGDAK